MAEKHSSADWIARVVAVVGTVVGIVLSILSLRLGYSNSRWQREIQEGTAAERILVHLDATQFASELAGIISSTPKGEVGMEVVNVGLRPVFIKRAEMRIHDRSLTLYEHDLTPALSDDETNAIKPLGPSETIRYKRGWDFEKWEETEVNLQNDNGTFTWLELPNSQIKDIDVEVQTTRKTFVFQHQQIVYVSLLTKHEDKRRPSKQSPDH